MNTWDEAKRQETLRERGFDFADAEELFAGRRYYSRPDNRRDYGEERFITVGYFSGRFVAVVWAKRDGGRRIISMRYGHEREERRFQEHLD